MQYNTGHSSIEILKYYFLEKDNAYLLDDDNNGKAIMLSGAWGSGKTHFWKEEIEIEQKRSNDTGEMKYKEDKYKSGLHFKLKEKNKAYVYVSLYGKTSMESIELDIFMKAYQNTVGDADFVSKTLSVFTNLGKNLGNIALKGTDGAALWIENLVNKDKFDKAGEFLADGGVICFDDFERKSKDIDLNDLFGFISQLTIEYRCKVIIILNSEVFKNKEADIFSQVKEKTISKFFYFNPSIEELFESISKSSKYNILNSYKKNILFSIKETNELNARVYIQVLDNCLEWLRTKGKINPNIIRVLVLGTFNFVLNHLVLDYQEIVFEYSNAYLKYDTIPLIHTLCDTDYFRFPAETPKKYREFTSDIETNSSYLIDILQKEITKLDNDNNPKYPDKYQNEYLSFVDTQRMKLKALWKYGYELYYVGDVNKATYTDISQFIKTGILNT